MLLGRGVCESKYVEKHHLMSVSNLEYLDMYNVVEVFDIFNREQPLFI